MRSKSDPQNRLNLSYSLVRFSQQRPSKQPAGSVAVLGFLGFALYLAKERESERAKARPQPQNMPIFIDNSPLAVNCWIATVRLLRHSGEPPGPVGVRFRIFSKNSVQYRPRFQTLRQSLRVPFCCSCTDRYQTGLAVAESSNF